MMEATQSIVYVQMLMTSECKENIVPADRKSTLADDMCECASMKNTNSFEVHSKNLHNPRRPCKQNNIAAGVGNHQHKVARAFGLVDDG
jgi:hypothetical protein